MDFSNQILDSLERKWLDPDYDFANGRYYDYDEGEEDEEETYLTLEEYFELVNNRK